MEEIEIKMLENADNCPECSTKMSDFRKFHSGNRWHWSGWCDSCNKDRVTVVGNNEQDKNPPLWLRDGQDEEIMEQIRDAINIVVGGMVAGEVRSFKATTALTVLFRIFYENPNYKEKTPEQLVLDVITR